MAGTLDAIVRGLASATEDVGTTLQKKEQMAKALQRQQAEDALDRLLKLNAIGGREVMSDPTQAAIAENRAYGEARTPTQLEQMGAAPEVQTVQLPDGQGGTRTVLINPDKSAAALAAKRALEQLTTKEGLDTQRTLKVEQDRSKNAYQQAVDVANLKLQGRAPLVHTFADGVKQSTDGGKTWTKIGDAPAPKTPGLKTWQGPHGETLNLPEGTAPPQGYVPYSKPTSQAGSAPMAAKVGQAGEMLKKLDDLFGVMDNMNVTLGQSASRDLADKGVHIPLIGTLPGSKGAGNLLMSNSPAYAQYQAALSPFILAAAHALSGARINQDQVEQIRKSIELAPGDFSNQNVVKQKTKNLVDLVNSIGGSLPADAMQAQEAQMGDESIQRLTNRGYRPRVSESPATPQRRSTDAGNVGSLYDQAFAALGHDASDDAVRKWVKAHQKP